MKSGKVLLRGKKGSEGGKNRNRFKRPERQKEEEEGM